MRTNILLLQKAQFVNVNKILTYPFLLVIILSSFSCTKEYSFEHGAKPVSFLVRTYIDKRGGDSTVSQFKYDNQGRVISISSLNGQSSFYNYKSDRYTIENFSGNTKISNEIDFINSMQLVDSIVVYEKRDTTAAKFFYNGKRQLVQVKEYNINNNVSVLTNTTIAEFDANGNETREYNTNNNQISYEYTSYPYNLNVGLIYLPSNRDFMKTSTYSGRTNKIYNHTYTFDSYGRITNETVKDSNGNLIVSKTYGYDT